MLPPGLSVAPLITIVKTFQKWHLVFQTKRQEKYIKTREVVEMSLVWKIKYSWSQMFIGILHIINS